MCCGVTASSVSDSSRNHHANKGAISLIPEPILACAVSLREQTVCDKCFDQTLAVYALNDSEVAVLL